MSEGYTKLPPVPIPGQQLQRLHHWSSFLHEQAQHLEYLYNHLLLPEHRDRVTLEDWINFAFTQTSLLGLKSYT